jgi:hypothetical protein
MGLSASMLWGNKPAFQANNHSQTTVRRQPAVNGSQLIQLNSKAYFFGFGEN